MTESNHKHKHILKFYFWKGPLLYKSVKEVREPFNKAWTLGSSCQTPI